MRHSIWLLSQKNDCCHQKLQPSLQHHVKIYYSNCLLKYILLKNFGSYSTISVLDVFYLSLSLSNTFFPQSQLFSPSVLQVNSTPVLSLSSLLTHWLKAIAPHVHNISELTRNINSNCRPVVHKQKSGLENWLKNKFKIWSLATQLCNFAHITRVYCIFKPLFTHVIDCYKKIYKSWPLINKNKTRIYSEYLLNYSQIYTVYMLFSRDSHCQTSQKYKRTQQASQSFNFCPRIPFPHTLLFKYIVFLEGSYNSLVNLCFSLAEVISGMRLSNI